MARPLSPLTARAAVVVTMVVLAVSAHIAAVEAAVAHWRATEGR